jgi:CRP/FNR family transcriptional regulator, nitrogen oxide reductase regulator
MLTINRNRTAIPPATPRNFLATTEIFKGVPAEGLRDIERRMVEKKFPKGASLFLEGDPAQYAWFVKEGHVKAVTHIPNGRCQTFCMVGPKNMFGICCALGGGDYPCNSVAETDVTVVSLPLSDFLSVMARYPQISMAVARQLSRRLRDSKETQIFEQESVEKRILHVLVNLVQEFGNTIPLTRREIAEMAGTTVETSIRTFSRLEAQGFVYTARGRITLGDLRVLRDRLNHFGEERKSHE